MEEAQRVPLPGGVLDLKWCPEPRATSRPRPRLLGVACSDGAVRLLTLGGAAGTEHDWGLKCKLSLLLQDPVVGRPIPPDYYTHYDKDACSESVHLITIVIPV